ncbi:unnamed protein product [Choristocarpus tenellus]
MAPLLPSGGMSMNAIGSVKVEPVEQVVDTILPLGGELDSKKSVDQRTVIKFGGSSLATAERLTEVAILVKRLIEEGQKPIMVCSAMGKTTNNLLNAGQFALDEGKVYIDAIRTLHMSTCDTLDLGEYTKREVEALLEDLRSLLEGVGMLRELTPRCVAHFWSYLELFGLNSIFLLVPYSEYDIMAH